MFLSGTLLNAATVLVGGALGTFLGDRLPVRVREAALRALGIFTFAMGVKFAVETGNLLYPLFAVLLGGIIGASARLADRLDAFALWLQDRVSRRGPGAPVTAGTEEAPRPRTIAEAFVTSSIVFCVGPLTFLGSIQNGLSGDATLLTVKSVLDGFAALAIGAALGWRVLLSIAVILVYQGGLAAGATLFSGLLSEAQLTEMNATGGLLLVGIGLRLLQIKDVRVADFLPAILLAPFLVAVGQAIAGISPL